MPTSTIPASPPRACEMLRPMSPPPLCLHCGHLGAADPCVRCGRRAPAVRWQTRDGSDSPAKRAFNAVGFTVLALVLVGAAAAMLLAALAISPVGAPNITLGLVALLVLALAALCAWMAGYIAFVRSWAFEADDHRVTGHVTAFGGRIFEAFGLSYVDVPAKIAPEAAVLSSAASPAALAKVPIPPPRPEYRAFTFDPALRVVTAAILGMAARGEIAIEPGEAERFWIGERPSGAPAWMSRRIWVRRAGSASPALAFERVFLGHLEALAAERAATPAPGPLGYRTGAPPDVLPSVPLVEVMARVAPDGDLETLLAPAEGGPDVSAALAAAIDADGATMLGIALEADSGMEC